MARDQGGVDKVSLYETDFVKWAEEQAMLLTERRFDLLDLEHLIEEVDDLAGRHRDALESYFRVIFIHLLKLAYTQGSRDPERAWKRSVENARDEMQFLLEDYPSLHHHIMHLSARAYTKAVVKAHKELRDYGDDHEPFPETSPWTAEQVLDEAFWPGEEVD
jgi:hypothetical protein